MLRTLQSILFEDVMNSCIYPVIVWIFCSGYLYSQTCSGLNAGTSELTTVFPKNLLDGRTGVQLRGLKFTIESSNDFDLSGDPDPSTPAGIRFLVFSKQPDLDGWISEKDLEDHPDIIRTADGNPLFAGTGERGTITIGQRAPGELPFGQQIPVGLWFVPITVHNVNAPDFKSAFEGPCIHVNGNDPISIYFIRHIKLELNLNYWDRETNEITIPVSGGLPEIDPDLFQYEVEITDCETKEKISLEKRGFNLFVFKMNKLYGEYDILTTDGFSPIYLLQCFPFTKTPVRLIIPDKDVYQGEEFCLPVRVRNFWDIDSFSFALQWDNSVLEFTGFGPPGNIHPELKQGIGPVFHRLTGRKGGRFTWKTNGEPVTIPDGDVLFHLCFKAIGPPGSRTPVDSLSEDHRFYGGELYQGPRVEAGDVRIVREDYIGFSYDMLSCPATSGPVDVAMNITGKNLPFTLSFDPADTKDRIITGSQDTLYDIPQGIYNITVTDALGQNITKIDQEFSTGFQGDFRVTLDSVRTHDPLCPGDANGEIYVDVRQNKSLDYSLFYQKGNDIIGVDNPLMKGLGAGEYTIWAVDQRGCEAYLPKPVVLKDPLPLTVVQDNIRLDCEETDTLVRFEKYVEGGTGVVEYALEDDSVFYRLGRDTLLGDGNYTLHMRDFLGCEATGSFSVEAGASDISFSFDQSEDTLFVYPDESFEVAVDVSSSDVDLDYSWSATGGSLMDFVQNKARFTFEHDGIIELTITDPFGCDYTDQLPVVLVEDEEPGEGDNDDDEEECTVSIPNAITPNGDGINDHLEVFSDCAIQVTHIRIFDKWGGELYHVQGGKVEASIWVNIPPGVVMVQVTYETGPPEAGKAGVVKTVAGGVLIIK